MTCKQFEKKKPGRLWTMSSNQARNTVQHFKVRGTNGYNNSSRGGDNVAAMQKKWRTPLEEPSRTRVVRWPNDVARTSSLRLNNSKVSLQSDIENARLSTLRPNNSLGSRQKYTEKAAPSSSGLNNHVISSQKNRNFSSRSNNGSVSREKNVKKPRLSSSTMNNSLVSPHENAKKPMFSSLRPDNGGASTSKNMEISRPSPSGPNNDMISSLKDIEKPWPSSASLNGGSVPPVENIKRFMPVKSRHSRLRGEFSSRKPTFIGSNSNSNSTFSILNKSPPSLVHGHSSNVEMSIQAHRAELWKAEKEASTSSSALDANQVMHGLQPQGNNMEQNAVSMSVHDQLDSRDQKTALVSEGKADGGKYKSKMREPLFEEKLGSQMDDDGAKENSRPKKRRRKDNENDDVDDDESDQNLVGAESGTAVITETAVVKDCHTEVSHHFVSKSFKLQQYSSLPIDEPIWSGIIKTCDMEYVSLAAHLSTKYCDMVSKLSRSLQPVLEVTKLSRLEAWPKSFEASRPTDDNIALYFFPDKMRQDADLDQLVKEVVENDMVLRAVIDEAELLIIPSVLLPEQYQTFQEKPYLWGVFRPRKEKFAIVEEQHGIGHCAQEMVKQDATHHSVGKEGMVKQHATHHAVGKKGHTVVGLNMGVGLETPQEAEGQGIVEEQHDIGHCAQEEMVKQATHHAVGKEGMVKQHATHHAVGKKGHTVVGLNMGVGLETPQEAEGQGMEQLQTPSARPDTRIPVEGVAQATSTPTMPAAMSANDGPRATSAPTMPAAVSANDGQFPSSFSVPTGAMLGFIVRRTPRLEFLIEEMQREGTVVLAMQGEMIGSGLGQATTTE